MNTRGYDISLGFGQANVCVQHTPSGLLKDDSLLSIQKGKKKRVCV